MTSRPQVRRREISSIEHFVTLAMILILATVAGWLFFSIAEDVPEAGKMVALDRAISTWLATHRTPTGGSIGLAVSAIGGPVLTIVMGAVALGLAVERDWRRLTIWAVACVGVGALHGALKIVFHRDRPTPASGYPFTSWSFPSGHSMDSLVVYGLLAYGIARRFPRAGRAVIAATWVVVGAIGLSRIYLGVHYLSDVLAGYCAGVVWLTLCIAGEQHWHRGR